MKHEHFCHLVSNAMLYKHNVACAFGSIYSGFIMKYWWACNILYTSRKDTYRGKIKRQSQTDLGNWSVGGQERVQKEQETTVVWWGFL